MGGYTPISPWRPVATVIAALGAASVSTAVVPDGVHAALFNSTGDCHVRWGASPQTAVATDMLLAAADPPMIFGVSPGEVIAVIQDASATGSLYVTWLTH